MPCEYLVNAETMTCGFGEKQKENVGSSAIEFSHLKWQKYILKMKNNFRINNLKSQ